jgi:hypothetical protein
MAAPKSKEDNRSKKVVKAKPVTGFEPLKFKDHTITQKRSGRYEVTNAKGVNINGKEKETLLLDAKLLKPSLPKADAPAAT